MRTREALVTALCLSFPGAACSPAGGDADPATAAAEEGVAPWFRESAHARGLDFVHVAADSRKYRFPEIMGTGAAAGDFDGDGDLDLYVVQSGDLDRGPTAGVANRLFMNRGDGTFEDRADAAGAADAGYGMGVAAGDVDQDGDLDLYVTNVGPNRLYLNRGDGTFEERAEAAGVADPGWGTSATFLDYDRDGALDLFVVNYVVWSLATDLVCRTIGDRRDYCQPNEYSAPSADVLYRGLGDGTFEDVTRAAGIDALRGNGLGVVADDFDLDGWTDVYVANDMVGNALWQNDGQGHFVERGLLAGCAFNGDGEAEASMGVAAFDVEADGDSDLFMTHWWGQRNTFYENRGDGLFSDKSALTGLATPSIPFTAFGVGFADFDHDGFEDVFVANGRVTYITPLVDEEAPYVEPNQLFRGLGGRRFEEVLPRGGTSTDVLGSSRGAVFGDFDGDGDVDLVVVNNQGPLHFLENVAPKRGHWLQLDVRNAAGANALGARVRVRLGDRTWTRVVQPGFGYASSHDSRLHVGLGTPTSPDAAGVSVLVRFPDGSEHEYGPLEPDRVHVLRPE